jgi:replicative DNA helicase
MEMNVEQVAGRIACLFAGVDYKQFLNGRLQPELRDRVFWILKHLQQDELTMNTGGTRPPYFLLTSSRGTRGGVGWLQSKIRECDPDLVIVDGMYLMHDDRSGKSTQEWQRVMHLSRDLKMTGQEFNIPVIGVTQANRGSEKSRGQDLTELAFSDALGQDADAVFRVSKVEKIEENIKRTYIYLTAPGLREGKFDGIVIRGEPATNFDYVRTMVPEDENAEYDEKKQSAASTIPQRSQFTRSAQNFVDPRINNGHLR